MNDMKIHVIRGTALLCGVPTYTGSIGVKALMELKKIPHRNSVQDTGYQRNAHDYRINKLAKDIQERKVDIPTAILLNVRKDISGFIEESNGVATMNLDVLKQSKENLIVVDGQHRLLALEKALGEGSSFPNFKIHFVCMVGADEMEEMKQFYVVNKNAKSVPTDLAYNLLRKQSEGKGIESSMIQDLIGKGEMWKVDGDRLAHLANKDSSIWKGKIRLPNEPKGVSTVPSASFIKSLKPALENSEIFKNLGDGQRIQLLTVYWEAIKEILGEDVFGERCKYYSLQKGIGVQVMHGILPTLIEYVRNSGSVFKKSLYVEVMQEALENLSEVNNEGDQVSGKEFWETGQSGGIGTFSSEAGKKRLIERIRHLLPRLELKEID